MDSNFNSYFKQACLFIVFCSLSLVGYGQAKIKVRQSGAIVTDVSQETPHSSAVLDVSSNSKGVLFPQMNTATRDLIPSPAEGLLIYNTDNKTYEFFNGTEWFGMGVVSGSGGSGNYDADALNVFGRMSDLTDQEKDAINEFIISEKAVGNYQLYDEFFLFSLGSANGLVGFKSKNATVHGGVTWDNHGATFDGIDGYLDSNFNLKVDGENYSQDDALINTFVKDVVVPTHPDLAQLFGVAISPDLTDLVFNDNFGQRMRINAAVTGYVNVPENQLSGNTLVSMRRTADNSMNILNNGIVLGADKNKTSTAIPEGNLFFGAANQNSSPDNFVNGTLSTALIGGAVGFNHYAHYYNIKKLLSDLKSNFDVPLDSDAELVISRMDGLNDIEKNAINNFIISEKAAGNYQLYDEFFLFPLGPSNGLIGFKHKTAWASSGVTWDTNGATFNGTNGFIDTNFNLKADGINYKLNDALINAFVKDAIVPMYPNISHLFGVYISSDLTDVSFNDNIGQRMRINASAGGYVNIQESPLSNNTLVALTRTADNAMNLLNDGIVLGPDQNRSSTDVPNGNLFVGTLNQNTSPGEKNFMKGTLSTTLIGAAHGFNHAAHNANVRELLTDLGVDLTPEPVDPVQAVLNRMTGLSATEESAITTFINAEVAAGNYDKYDEFFLFPLGSTNGLIGFKSKTATAHGGVTWDIDGVTFNGTDGYLRSGFIPQIDGSNYQLEDAMDGHFVRKSNTNDAFQKLSGAENVGVAQSMTQYRTNLLRARVNATGIANFTHTLGDNELTTQVRINDGSEKTGRYINGELVSPLIVAAKTSLPTVEFYIGASNNDGIPGQFSSATLSTTIFGAAHGFNQAAHNTNVRQLLTDLGLDLTPEPEDPVQAVLNRMTGLSATEESAITTFINAEVAAGNYDKYDEFFLFPLGSTNGLIGFKSKTATAHGEVTWDINGATGDGVDGYIDTNFNPLTDGVNYSTSNAIIGSFVKTADNYGLNTSLFGAFENTSRRAIIYKSGENIAVGVNSNNNMVASEFQNNSLYVAERLDDSNLSLYEDGLSILNVARDVSAPPDYNIYLLAHNNAGLSTAHSEKTISTFIIGAGIGFDQAAHNTNVRQLLTDLGLDLTPTYDPDVQAVFDRMPTLTEPQKTAINDFILAEKAAGNYDKYDEFFLFPLGSINGLTGFKSKTATAHGGVTWSSDGATFDGSGYINSNWVPDADNINYQLNDGLIGVYVQRFNSGAGVAIVNGGDDKLTGIYNYVNTYIIGSVNSSGSAVAVNHYLHNHDNIVLARTSNTLLTHYSNGASYGSSSKAGTESPSIPLYIGAYNHQGAATEHFNGTISSVVVGSATGFDQIAHHNNLHQLLTDLGVDMTKEEPEVQAVFNRMSTLNSTQKDAIRTFILAEKEAGNYDKYDEFFLFPLGSTNGLIGFKSKTATAHGGVTWDINGATFDGVDDYIDTNWVPNVDGSNFQQNDALVGAFCKQYTGDSQNERMYGAHKPADHYISIDQRHIPDLQVSTNENATGFIGDNNGYADETLYTQTRTAGSGPGSTQFYVDGVKGGLEGATVSNTPPTNSITVGGINWTTDTVIQYWTGTVSSFVVGAAIGFDHAAHNTNIRQLLTDLGLTL